MLSLKGIAMMLVFATSLALANGCTSVAPYRTVLDNCEAWGACGADCKFDASTGELHEPLCADRVIETAKGRYGRLYIAEFDDQGWAYPLVQQGTNDKTTSVERIVSDLFALPKNQLYTIVVYVHGWKHNAAPNDSNMKEFRVLLEKLQKIEFGAVKTRPELSEHQCPARQVIGIYVGWRGASIPDDVITNATFWSRKMPPKRWRMERSESFSREFVQQAR